MPEATALRAVLSCAGGIGAAARNREGAIFFKGGPSENCRSPTLLVLFHGLEESSRSHSSKVFANFARERGFAFAVPHSRGCSGELNLGFRAYHSGDFEEIGWILQRFRTVYAGPIITAGISLGAMRCCAGLKKRVRRPPRQSVPLPVCARRLIWRPVTGPSGVVSTGWSAPACLSTPWSPKRLKN